MSETHAQLVNTALENLASVLRKLRRGIGQGWLHVNLSIAQVRVLFVLQEQHTATMSAIAGALGIGLPTASHLVDKLVYADLAERSEDPKDRRYALVHLTGAGEDLMESISQGRLEQLRLWLDQLNEEELTALQVGVQALARVAETAQPNAEPPQPNDTSG